MSTTGMAYGIILLLCFCAIARGTPSFNRAEDEEVDSYHPSFQNARLRSQLNNLYIPQFSQSFASVNWVDRANEELRKSQANKPIRRKAKNVIFFLGDGMGVSTLTAARFLKAQQEGKSGTEGHLSWEDFPYTGMIKTYNTDKQVPDSAGTATAYLGGEKARSGVIGVNQNVIRGDCASMAGNKQRSILKLAVDAGMKGGLISTARITHATPAAAFASCPERNWEAVSNVSSEDRDTCRDIAWQLVHDPDNQRLKVVLGGGRQNFLPKTAVDPEYPNLHGKREDGADLIKVWLDSKKDLGLENGQYAFVDKKSDFMEIPKNIEYLFGMFEPSHMKYDIDRQKEGTGDEWQEPSLAEMVAKSIEILDHGKDGYFLFVEGGRVDHGHHAGQAKYALTDAIALNEAVEMAKKMTNEKDTLILLTADHSHTFTMAGYGDLEMDILGEVISDNEAVMALDGKPYLTLGYNNGPGYQVHRMEGVQEIPRKDPTTFDTSADSFRQDAGVPLVSETHGGEDVAVYARGPMAHFYSGQHEQNYIAHVIKHAACLGDTPDGVSRKHCEK